MTFLKFNHWQQYGNFLIGVSPPFLALYVSPTEQNLSMSIIGFFYLILFIIVPLTNRTIDLDKKVEELEDKLKKYEES